MAEMSVIWLRVAAALYSLGLLHAILTLVRRRERLFRVALGAFGLGSVFHLVSIAPVFQLYVTPLNIDPEKPALPITHPLIYSVYLAKLLGSFTTGQTIVVADRACVAVEAMVPNSTLSQW